MATRRLSFVGGLLVSMLLTGCGLFNRRVDTTSVVPPQTSYVADGSPTKAPKELPASETVRVCLATAAMLAQKGEDREAIALYEKARSLEPKRTDIARKLAVLHDRQDDFQKALEEYGKALKSEPKNAHLHNDIGYCYYCRGRWAEAEKSLREAIALDPSLHRAWTNLGMTLAQQGKMEESHKAFEKAVGPAQAWSNIGFILVAQGKREDAKDAYRKALDIDPNLNKTRDALVSLTDPPTARAKTPAKGREVAGKRGAPPSRGRHADSGPGSHVDAANYVENIDRLRRREGEEESEGKGDR